MITLTKLTAILAETDFHEGPGHHHNVGTTHDVETTDGRKGVFTRYLRTGPEGIIFSAGKAAVLIPTAELWKLVEKADPNLAVPKKIVVPANAGLEEPVKKSE